MISDIDFRVTATTLPKKIKFWDNYVMGGNSRIVTALSLRVISGGENVFKKSWGFRECLKSRSYNYSHRDIKREIRQLQKLRTPIVSSQQCTPLHFFVVLNAPDFSPFAKTLRCSMLSQFIFISVMDTRWKIQWHTDKQEPQYSSSNNSSCWSWNLR